MKKVLLLGVLLLTAVAGMAREPKIQIAVLLDTSNSMDGLIDQAKSQLWTIVNDLALTRKRGRIPVLEVALYEYGKSSLPAGEGYLRQWVPLTTDLDKVSEALFELKTRGGEEYCGRVIHEATGGLAWSERNDDFKAIFIAGNEPFNQGDHDFRAACRAAIAQGIVVNTIFCGDERTGINTFWKEGAELADGTFACIDQNAVKVAVKAPQDAEIQKLGKQLNQTYLAYGAAGASGRQRQQEQDRKAADVSESVALKRTLAKASVAYRAESWDLVDAVEQGKVKVEEVEAEALPEPMQDMDDEERTAFIETKSKERREIKAKLTELRKAREDYVAQQRLENPETLDKALLDAVAKQLKTKSFTKTQ
jgi:hypothetical protein